MGEAGGQRADAKRQLVQISADDFRSGEVRFRRAAAQSGSGQVSPGISVDWEKMSQIERQKQRWILFHEIGHMKTSRIQIDTSSKRAKMIDGFYVQECEIEARPLFNGDVFYILKSA